MLLKVKKDVFDSYNIGDSVWQLFFNNYYPNMAELFVTGKRKVGDDYHLLISEPFDSDLGTDPFRIYLSDIKILDDYHTELLLYKQRLYKSIESVDKVINQVKIPGTMLWKRFDKTRDGLPKEYMKLRLDKNIIYPIEGKNDIAKSKVPPIEYEVDDMVYIVIITDTVNSENTPFKLVQEDVITSVYVNRISYTEYEVMYETEFTKTNGCKNFTIFKLKEDALNHCNSFFKE
jgi:hypothetical protein